MRHGTVSRATDDKRDWVTDAADQSSQVSTLQASDGPAYVVRPNIHDPVIAIPRMAGRDGLLAKVVESA
jgi:hypothetical protein